MLYIVAQMPRDLQLRMGISTRIPDADEPWEAQERALELIRLAKDLGAIGYYRQDIP